jgi:hypothetical protein
MNPSFFIIMLTILKSSSSVSAHDIWTTIWQSHYPFACAPCHVPGKAHDRSVICWFSDHFSHINTIHNAIIVWSFFFCRRRHQHLDYLLVLDRTTLRAKVTTTIAKRIIANFLHSSTVPNHWHRTIQWCLCIRMKWNLNKKANKRMLQYFNPNYVLMFTTHSYKLNSCESTHSDKEL